jgi:ribosome-binding factor A
MKHRLDRVNEVLKRELGDLVQREFSFAAKLVTVQQVDVTPDLKHAHVYVGVIGSDAERREAIGQLADARVRLQQELSKRVVLKYTPHLHFKGDEAIERGTRVLTILEELQLPEEDDTDEQEPGQDENRRA